MIRILRERPKRLKIGNKAEELVEEACRELKAEGKILGFEKEDRPGSDFSIHFLDGETLKIEIKISFYGEFLHEIKYSTSVLIVPLKEKRLSAKKKRKLIDRIKRNIVEMEKSKIG